jgi:hypothetical protein
MDDVLLFGRGGLFDQSASLANALANQAQSVVQRLHAWTPDDLLNTPAEDVIGRLLDEGTVQCPRLLVDDAELLDPTEVDQQYVDFGERRSRRVTRMTLVVPFEGEKDVFTLRADTSSTNPPRVLRLQDQELHLVVDDPPGDGAEIRMRFDGQIADIEKYLDWSRQQIDQYNQQIRRDVPTMVAERREQLSATRDLQADIGFPTRGRPDADA